MSKSQLPIKFQNPNVKKIGYWILDIGNLQNGSVLLLALLILSTVLASSIAVGTLVVKEIRANRQLDDAVVSYYAAESGIEKGLWVARQEPSTGMGSSAIALPNAATASLTTTNKGEAIVIPFIAKGATTQVDLYNPDGATTGNLGANIDTLHIKKDGPLAVVSCKERVADGTFADCGSAITFASDAVTGLDPKKAYRFTFRADGDAVRSILLSGTKASAPETSVVLGTPLTVSSTGAFTASRQALKVSIPTSSPFDAPASIDGGTPCAPTTPEITAPTMSQVATIGAPFTVDVESTVEGRAGTQYQLLQFPPSSSALALPAMHPTTGVITWTPAVDQSGIQSISYSVTEQCGGSTQKTMQMAVGDFALTNTPTNFIMNEGQTVTFRADGAPQNPDGTYEAVTYYWIFGVPLGKTGQASATNYDVATINIAPSNFSAFKRRYTNPGIYNASLFAVSETGKRAWGKPITITANNVLPVASAGIDFTVAVNVTAPFNGSNSFAQNPFDQLFYYWDVNADDGLSFIPDLTNADLSGASPRTFQYTTPGTYIATLHVCDDDNTCMDDTVQVTVTP
ncbi:hypothetical protein HY625_01205 [Candidatus Uhrbacteria bacterium]|nr:hypothetical protein [Candidatus Uhrbacteria bacterium]